MSRLSLLARDADPSFALNASAPTFPPDTLCFTQWQAATPGNDASIYASCGPANLTVTQPMVDFLNLTQNTMYYLQAYCLNPPEDDSCPFGYCPQSDVAGPLVRIANYLNTFFLLIILFYRPEWGQEAFFSTVLTIYSILITSALSIMAKSLTKLHSLIATLLVASPAVLVLTIYSIRSMFGHAHRLDAILGGQHKRIHRFIVLTTGGVLIGFVITSALPGNIIQFSQSNCNQYYYTIKLLLLPLIVFTGEATKAPGVALLFVAPLILLAFSWIFVIWLRRYLIWATGMPKIQFWRVWRMVGEEFPFIYCCTTVFLPTAYWVVTIELALADSNDNRFTLSFGQVLAMFMIVPGLIQVVRLLPRLGRWFTDLGWVRFVTRRPQRPLQSVLPDMDLAPRKYDESTTGASAGAGARASRVSTRSMMSADGGAAEDEEKHDGGYETYSPGAGKPAYYDAWDEVRVGENQYGGVPESPLAIRYQPAGAAPTGAGYDTRGQYAWVNLRGS